MKIKIISYSQDGYVCDHDPLGTGLDPLWVMRDCTNWDDVTKEQYDILVKWCAKKNRDNFSVQYQIYCQEECRANERIQEYLDIIHKEEMAAEQKRKKREANKRAKQQAQKAAEEAKEREQLEQLMKKYGDKK